MGCPLCLRITLLTKLRLQPHNQEIRLRLMALISCTGEKITTGVTYPTEKKNFCRLHAHWINVENFLQELNRRETVELLFDKNTKYLN